MNVDPQEYLIHQSRMNACVEAEEFNLVRLLNPKISIDGDQWCVLWGENLQDGITGFGDTPAKAVYAFNAAWHDPLNKKSAK
jgi:hypothetical protein